MKGFALSFREKLGYGMGDAGCNMIGGAITNDPRELVSYQSYHLVIVVIATLILSLSLLPMAEWFSGKDKARGYQLAIRMLALIGLGMFLFYFAIP